MGHEAYSEDKNGKKADAHIHEPILAEGDKVRESKKHREERRKRTGFSIAALDYLYGKEEGR